MIENKDLYAFSKKKKPWINNETLTIGIPELLRKWAGLEKDKPLQIIPQSNEEFGNYLVIALEGKQPFPEDIPEIKDKLDKMNSE